MANNGNQSWLVLVKSGTEYKVVLSDLWYSLVITGGW
jgi:hypothetical protein